MYQKNIQQYKEQMINTMTPGELLLLLYDELVKRLTQAELALDKKDYDLLDASIGRSLQIINYLDDTLDRQYPISHELSKLYEYFDYDLRRVQIGRRKFILTHIKEMVEDLRESFREANKNGEGNG